MEEIRSLVTGGAGFLGSHLVDHLIKNGHQVIALDNEVNGSWSKLSHWQDHPRLKLVNQDILELTDNDPNFKNLDYVFHLAGIECPVTSLKKPEIFMDTNIKGTVNVLQASKQSKLKKFVFASSSSVYGIPSTPTLETDVLDPTTPAGLSKMQAEEAVCHWGNIYDFPTNSLRIFNAYGPRCSSKLYPGNVFGIWMKQLQAGNEITIVGNGEHARDFVYCTDVSNAFYVAALEGKSGEAYNIGAGIAVEIKTIASMLKGKITYLKEVKDEPIKTWADISKFQFDCSWQPRIPMESGIEFSLDVINQWADMPLWSKEDLDNFFQTWFEIYS